MSPQREATVAVTAHAMRSDVSVILAGAELLATAGAARPEVVEMVLRHAQTLAERLDVLVRTGALDPVD